MAKTTVAQLEEKVLTVEGCVEDNTQMLNEVSGKIDNMVKELKNQKEFLENGLSKRIAMQTAEENAKQRAEELAKQTKELAERWEREKEERRLQIEEQKAHAAIIGQKKDRTNRVLIAAVPVLTVVMTIIVQKLLG